MGSPLTFGALDAKLEAIPQHAYASTDTPKKARWGLGIGFIGNTRRISLRREARRRRSKWLKLRGSMEASPPSPQTRRSSCTSCTPRDTGGRSGRRCRARRCSWPRGPGLGCSLRRFLRSFLCRKSPEMFPNQLRVLHIERARVRLLLRDADLDQHVEDLFAFDFQLASQIINSNLHPQFVSFMPAPPMYSSPDRAATLSHIA